MCEIGIRPASSAQQDGLPHSLLLPMKNNRRGGSVDTQAFKVVRDIKFKLSRNLTHYKTEIQRTVSQMFITSIQQQKFSTVGTRNTKKRHAIECLPYRPLSPQPVAGLTPNSSTASVSLYTYSSGSFLAHACSASALGGSVG